MKKIVLFDLDGTLTDSSEGILNSVRYMLEKKALKVPDLATLHTFIGPPLDETLNHLYGLNKDESQKAVEIYREYYAEKGIKQLAVYPGIEEILETLSADYVLAIATSKPEFYAKKILADVNLSSYFTGIFGADLAGERSKKTDVIAYALEQLEGDSAVMIGDRKFDIIGAKENHLKSIGVLYGFGDLQEMTDAEADKIAATVEEIPAAVNRVFSN
ncbi:phosphoglycolate phosphatase [Enterococcus malodoratus]|uniref:HAD family hydrolase n=1 Tax=Enterococcus malodoratus TaxID=71451 RepID=UPI0008B576D1|nr:HAD family hydrolase [Enterococcus malodoratus]SES88544.1 phosphoglycolate phosphatase [Enterococcus malodoratus]